MPEIIAEIGQNHNGDMSLASEMIFAAKENGADVAKFQLYDAKALFAKENNPWYEYNCKTELTRDDLFFLHEVCQRAGIEFMASVFDIERIAWLEELDVSRYKVASRSINDEPLINAIIAAGKPILISLGMWEGESFPEINAEIEQIEFLYCVSKYPTDLVDLNFSKIDFSIYAGFSDHTLGVNAPITAMARGARIIEKHLTLDKTTYGPDHSCSMLPKELNVLAQYRDDLSLCL